MNNQEVADRLRRFGTARWSTTREFADALGMSTNSLNTGYLSGRSIPGPVVLERLHENGCSADWLLFGIGLPPAPTPQDLELQVRYMESITAMLREYCDALTEAEKQFGESIHRAAYLAYVVRWAEIEDKFWKQSAEKPRSKKK